MHVPVHTAGLLLGVAVAALQAGCLVSPDETLWQRRADAGDGPREARTARDAPGTEAADLRRDQSVEATCSPSGVPAACDPLSLGGCLAGTCYIARSTGAACVCPPGNVAQGGSCKTTVECAPGAVCAGKTPPGVCRATCDPAAPVCPTGMTCTAIGGLPKWGYCELV